MNRKIQLVFGSAVLILLAVGAVSYHSVVMSSESDQWVRHTHEVLESLQNLVSDMMTTESSARGFVLTNDQSYLESYHTGAVSAAQDEKAFRDLTVDNPQQRREVPALENLIARNIQLGERVIGLRRARGIEAAQDLIRGESGKRVMNEFREKVREMQEEELQLLQLRKAEAKQRSGWTRIFLIFGTALGLLMATAAGWSMQRRDSSGRELAHALEESEKQYRMLLDGVRDYAIFMMGPRGQITTWNAGAEQIKGYTADQIIGHNFSCFFRPEDIERGRPEEILRMTTVNGRHEEEGMRVRRDGSRFLANMVFTALRDAAGNLRGFSEFSHDLSESRESEARYRNLLEAAPDAMVVVNVAGEIVLLNVRAEKEFGYSRDELIGQKVKNIIPEGFAERIIADGTRSATEALAQQIGTGIELIGRRKDSSEFPIELMLSPLQGAEGILVTAAIRDITERKLAEEALKESLTTSKAALKDLADQKFALDQHARVSITDVHGTITYVNDKFCDISKFSREELIGQNHRILNSGRHPKEFFQQMYDSITTGKVWRSEIENRAKDGSTYWIDSAIVPFVGKDGTPHQYVGIGTDISQRKRAEEDLVKTVADLKRSNDELQQFAYVSSHDLQEPLRMVASYTQLLAKRYKGRLDSDADEFIAYAVEGCTRMQSLIKDLLAYSRAGKNGKAPCEVSSEDALQGALTNLRATIEQSSAIVTHDPLPAITSDDMQLIQVFQNLVGNAIKYRSAEVPRVHVSASKNGGSEWIFSVRDNGLGIAPQYFERIFVLFQRLHGREEFEGTGIGLAICKKIVERKGGRIWVESQPENGSTFFFTLPKGNDK